MRKCCNGTGSFLNIRINSFDFVILFDQANPTRFHYLVLKFDLLIEFVTNEFNVIESSYFEIECTDYICNELTKFQNKIILIELTDLICNSYIQFNYLIL